MSATPMGTALQGGCYSGVASGVADFRDPCIFRSARKMVGIERGCVHGWSQKG
jgi:hypothetical protein